MKYSMKEKIRIMIEGEDRDRETNAKYKYLWDIKQAKVKK